jgi:hypothetical protein
METLDKHFRALAKASFEKHGFASADLLSHWPEIVGADLALLCRPEKIVWPRGGEGVATLHLAVAAGRSLDIQYRTPQLLERINGFLGHAAIGKVRLHVAGSLARASSATVVPAAPVHAAPTPDTDDSLEAALARLERAIRSESQSSPQAQEARGHTPLTSSRTSP